MISDRSETEAPPAVQDLARQLAALELQDRNPAEFDRLRRMFTRALNHPELVTVLPVPTEIRDDLLALIERHGGKLE